MKKDLERRNQAYKKAVGQVIAQILPDVQPLNVVDVLLDPSRQTARVWLNTNHGGLKQLQARLGEVQRQLASKIKARYTPKLEFIIDDRYLEKMDDLFSKINENPIDSL